jgi:hypothetical protein
LFRLTLPSFKLARTGFQWLISLKTDVRRFHAMAIELESTGIKVNAACP